MAAQPQRSTEMMTCTKRSFLAKLMIYSRTLPTNAAQDHARKSAMNPGNRHREADVARQESMINILDLTSPHLISPHFV